MPIYTPRAASFSKSSAGTSDTSISNNVYKFLGCSIVSCNCTLGFNGTSSSLSLTLVEDTVNGDDFTNPAVPQPVAFSLPLGGLNQPLFVDNSFDFDPNAFDPTNVPFYFGGLLTSWQETKRDAGGKLITVNISDPREVLTGVQCLLGGFALSHNFSGSRYTDVDNIIDVFGYYDYGMTSGANEYGMQWSKIKTALENVGVSVSGIDFEFYFTGDAFEFAPDWYRIDDSIIDIVGLAQKVAQDGGSDLFVVARKVASNSFVVEFRAIRRTNGDILTQGEVESFVNDRTNIVESYRIGREYRNEPTSSVIIGGLRNSNYVAYPATYNQGMHLRSSTCPGTSGLKEDYNSFPADILVRLFGGDAEVYVESCTGSGLGNTTRTFDVDSGAIFPFWGFPGSGTQYPLIEPFINLDHLVFDRTSTVEGQLNTKLPRCDIRVGNFNVREYTHDDVFLDGDGDSDSRPFSYIYDAIAGGSATNGYIRGLPLNTEILRAALVDEELFYYLYSMYYPQFAKALDFPYPDFKSILDLINTTPAAERANLALENLPCLFSSRLTYSAKDVLPANPTLTNAQADQLAALKNGVINNFHTVIYQHVRDYAQEYMGRKFLVCLPKSEIMNRIWSNQVVPTRPDHPVIEYTVADRGYWENVPFELDGVVGLPSNSTFTPNQENQIRRRFMAEDGRFYAMVAIDLYPSGNLSFNSNGLNKAMFQDLPVSEFRPNEIGASEPSFVFVSASVNQLVKRPDLALVELPNSITFDPQASGNFHHNFVTEATYNDENLYSLLGLKKALWYFYKRDLDFRSAIEQVATAKGVTEVSYASKVISAWANFMRMKQPNSMQKDFNIEKVMDLKAVIIPLTSNWVSYGPWYATNSTASGMVSISVEDQLVPWNFSRPSGVGQTWDHNLNIAGNERLDRSISNTDYLDNAVITVAGFPEMGIGEQFGYNSNLTSIAVDFGADGIKTTYALSTYARKAGTFRKDEYDNVSKARIDTREDIINPENISISDEFYPEGVNKFRF